MRWCEFDNPEEEQKRLDKMLSKNPNDANALYGLATVHAYEFAFDKVVEYCEKAIELDPKNITFHALLSYASTQKGDNKRAIEELATIIELGGDDSDYYVDFAAYAQTGVDKSLAVKKIASLREEKKEQVAEQLGKWLLLSHLK